MAKDDEDAWRSIVDNYGDRPELDTDEVPAAEPPAAAPSGPSAPSAPSGRDETSWDDPYPDADWTTDRFVPPAPPPIPTTTTDRYVAWAGVLGSPALLLVCLVLAIDLPSFFVFLMVTGFVGGFLYLVLTMTREPRDPDDDGAVI